MCSSDQSVKLDLHENILVFAHYKSFDFFVLINFNNFRKKKNWKHIHAINKIESSNISNRFRDIVYLLYNVYDHDLNTTKKNLFQIHSIFISETNK